MIYDFRLAIGRSSIQTRIENHKSIKGKSIREGKNEKKFI
jgi:hypothetical protein